MRVKPELNLKKLDISDHATEKAIERFKCKDRDAALIYCKSVLGNAKYIGKTTCEQGGHSHMYVSNKVAIHVSLDMEKIKSIYTLDSNGHYIGLKDIIVNLYEKEFRKVDRKEYTKTKQLELAKIQTESAVAALKLRKFKSRSVVVKRLCDEEISKLLLQIIGMESEIKEIQKNKRMIARSIATVVI